MSLLQRAPIDVAVADPSAAEAVIETTATQLLDASLTPFPHAAAVVRHAQNAEQLAQFRPDERSLDRARLRTARFLRPVNHAMQEWWRANPQSPEHEVDELDLYGVHDSPSFSAHRDMHINILDSRLGRQPTPTHGPLIGILILQGAMHYRFSATRRSPFRPRDLEYFMTRDETGSRGHHTVVVDQGDLLLFAPSTFHEGWDGARSQRAIYTSHYKRRPKT